MGSNVPSGGSVVRLSGLDGAPRWRGRIHLGALAVAVPASVALTFHHPDLPTLGYCLGLVALYGVSATYHLMPMSPQRRSVWRRFDHAMIFVFIALAYGPLCRAAAPGRFGVAVAATAAVLGAACAGVKLFRFAGSKVFGGVMYMGLGWMGIILLPDALGRLSAIELGLLAAMVAFYMAGSIVLLLCRPDPVPHVFGYHEIWHACVVAASGCYFALVWMAPA